MGGRHPSKGERMTEKIGCVQHDCAECVARLAQSKRPWVGLTEDEVAQAMYRADAIVTGPMQFKLAKELEAKLKEKNT